VLVLEIELREKLIGFVLRFRQTHSLFQAANQCQVTSVVAKIIHDVGCEEIDPGSGRKDRAKIECIRQHPYNYYRSIAQVDCLSDDAAITTQLAFPKRIT